MIPSGSLPSIMLAAGGSRSAHAEPARILIVEDDWFIALEIENILLEAGYQVVGHAFTSREAAALCARSEPDLVLMDIRLGRGGDGIETARQLREAHGIACLFVTAQSDADTRARGEAAAAPRGWLSKPFSRSALIEAVAAALR